MKRTITGSILTGLVVLLQLQAARAQQWISRGPAPRSAHTAVFDPATKKMIVFGGIPDAYLTSTNFNDVFWLQNASGVGRAEGWQPVNAAGVRPAARGGHTAVYDAANGRMIVFGGGLGRTSPCVNDVWVLSNANGVAGTPLWQKLSPSGTPPAPRNLANAVYDPNTNRMTVFGGNDCFSSSYNDVWVLSNANGLGGTPAWSQLLPSGTAPSTRAASTSTYDPASNIMTTFGGAATGSILQNDTWLLSNANGLGGTPVWTQLSTSTPPAPRSAQSAVYDPTSDRMVMYGGSTSAGLMSDVWVLSNANGIGGPSIWTQLSPGGFPPPAPRCFHSAVYDPAANVMTIFGGFGDSLQIPINDSFVLTHANGE